MADILLVCKNCLQKFLWTEQDEKDNTSDEATGDILDGHNPKDYCPHCRIKQDGQRS